MPVSTASRTTRTAPRSGTRAGCGVDRVGTPVEIKGPWTKAGACPRIVWDGKQFVAVWQRQHIKKTVSLDNSDIIASRVDGWKPLDEAGVAVAATDLEEKARPWPPTARASYFAPTRNTTKRGESRSPRACSKPSK